MRVYRWIIAKYLAYGLLAVILFHLQSASYLFSIAGIRPMLVVSLAVAVSLIEKELASGLFGIFCGYLCDLFSDYSMGFYMFGLCLFCVVSSLVVRNYLRPSWPVCLGMTGGIVFLIRLMPLFFRYFLPGNPGGVREMLLHDIPMALYTAVCAVPLLILVRLIHKEAERRTEIRF